MIIDVSYYQGSIDWKEVGRTIDYAILRCGFGANVKSQDDKEFNYNANKCEKYGIPYGVYLYSYAKNTSAVEGEIRHVLRMIKNHKVVLPIYYDIEEQDICINYPVEQFASQFVKAIRAYGYKAGIYSGNYLFNKYLKGVECDSRWVAKYSSIPPTCECDLWQYSSKVIVKGIQGVVDASVTTDRTLFTKDYYNKLVTCVLKGQFGNGQERKELLFNRGINYWKVQNMVNVLYNM
jgi:GH25 family lysozyme M1 (1,4-beta-N-acetylmuramidase)